MLARGRQGNHEGGARCPIPRPADPRQQPPEGDKPLGPNGESALRKERERADELEKQLKAMQVQFGDIAKAFGVKPDKEPAPTI